MGSHQSSRGMNLENGWLYLTQHFHSISSDNINIIIRKPLICCKASTLHIPVQHWWLMKVSALKTISMNKEDKESVHNILWMCEKWYHYCEPCMCSHPLTLHISATFFAKQPGREIIFLSSPSLTNSCVSVLSRQEAQMRQVHWPGKGSNLASENLYSILEFEWNWKRVVKEIGPNNRVRVFVPLVRYLSIRKYEVREIGYFAI